LKVSPDSIATTGAAASGAEEAEPALELWNTLPEVLESLRVGLIRSASGCENSARPALTKTEEMYPARAAAANAFLWEGAADSTPGGQYKNSGRGLTVSGRNRQQV